jgi:hypothetical protein
MKYTFIAFIVAVVVMAQAKIDAIPIGKSEDSSMGQD